MRANAACPALHQHSQGKPDTHPSPCPAPPAAAAPLALRVVQPSTTKASHTVGKRTRSLHGLVEHARRPLLGAHEGCDERLAVVARGLALDVLDLHGWSHGAVEGRGSGV